MNLASEEDIASAIEAVKRAEPGEEPLLRDLCRRFPADVRASFLLGALLERLGQEDAALEAFDRTLALEPDHVQALSAKCAVLLRCGRAREAVHLLDEAVIRQPGVDQLRYNLGTAREACGDLHGALAVYDRLLASADFQQAAYMNRGYVLTRLRRLDQALENNRTLVGLAPRMVEAHFNLAEVLLASGKPAEALLACEEALRLVPGYSKARIASGLALSQLGKIDQAREAFERVRREDPGAIAGYVNLYDLRPPDDEDRFDPELIYLSGAFQALHDCDWTRRSELIDEARAIILARASAGRDFADTGLAYEVLTLPLAADLRRAVARGTSARYERNRGNAGLSSPRRNPDPARRLRIGYLSPDFCEHLNAYLMLPVLRLHDRTGFEVVCYSVGPGDSSPIRQSVQAASDRFVDVATLDDAAIAQAIQGDGVDVLVDVGGFTTYSRPGVVARRPAPVQAGYLGFPGTQGMSTVPWRIVDHIASPPGQSGDWTEALVHLPDTFFIYDRPHPFPSPGLSRADYGLPGDGFVFCGFNNYYKIEPGIFTLWMDILRAVPGSVLWLAGRNAIAAANLKREARMRGVDDTRLVFAPFDEREKYLARFALADLFLDTFLFNAMTTACDSLAAGLPVLTLPGREFPSRVAASLLHAAGFEDGIVETPGAYRDRAIEWGRHPDRLRALRREKLSRPAAMPLFDTQSRVRQLEQAYREMWRRHCLDLPPASFEVARTPAVRNPWH